MKENNDKQDQSWNVVF